MDINVSFDEQGRVRVLDADKYEQTKQLQEQCSGFSASKFCLLTFCFSIPTTNPFEHEK